mmetsp:Transcript_34219/g.78025  ORF Transcript_34219/g.78025 Transcript_34219/m.78025 type:complete len:454 (+) Transcript_34219:56-1417(+)
MGCHPSKGDVLCEPASAQVGGQRKGPAQAEAQGAPQKDVSTEAEDTEIIDLDELQEDDDDVPCLKVCSSSKLKVSSRSSENIESPRENVSAGSTQVPEDSESYGSSPQCMHGPSSVQILDLAKDCQEIARRALDEAQELMQTDMQVLRAEAILSQALGQIAAAGSHGDEAAKVMYGSAVFKAVAERSMQYDSLAGLLRPSSFVLQWEKENSCLWVNAPAGETWFEFKVAGYFDAPIQNIQVALQEIDLQAKYQPMLACPPRYLGVKKRHLLVTRSLVDVLLLRIEVIIEVMRFVNHDYGFLAERIRSEFPLDKELVPPKHWRNKRITVDTRSAVIPCGGGKGGTITMQASRVDLGFQLPKYALDFFCTKLSQDYLNNVRTCVKLVNEPGNPWKERLEADKDGFYAELAKADEVAQRREHISLKNLPGPEIFDRPGKFSDSILAATSLRPSVNA